MFGFESDLFEVLDRLLKNIYIYSLLFLLSSPTLFIYINFLFRLGIASSWSDTGYSMVLAFWPSHNWRTQPSTCLCSASHLFPLYSTACQQDFQTQSILPPTWTHKGAGIQSSPTSFTQSCIFVWIFFDSDLLIMLYFDDVRNVVNISMVLFFHLQGNSRTWFTLASWTFWDLTQLNQPLNDPIYLHNCKAPERARWAFSVRIGEVLF